MKYTATAQHACPSRRRGGRRFAMDYHRGDTLVAQRTYAYTYNNRSELIGDVVDGTGLNGWDYDLAAAASRSSVASRRQLSPNRLNRYTAIEDAEGTFSPTYDADGNQTRVKTSTGIWNVTYNAKNRPVLFSKEGENLTVACTYDYMGRRATKKVTENGTVTLL